MYESDDEQSERVFYYHESKNNNIENDDSLTLYAFEVCLFHISLSF